MKVVVLCGGLGTRMREETEYRPKPMVDIGGKPILWHIMKTYAHYGHRDFVMCLGYKGSMIKEYFLNYEAMNNDFTISLGRFHQIAYHGAHPEQDFRVTLADTGPETMTGGRVLRVQKHTDNDTFMVTYGDGVADIDMKKLLMFHRSHGKLATISSVRPSSRFGLLDVDDSGRVSKFAEKPMVEGWANMGYFVFEPGIFDYLDGDECILEREPMERLSREGQLRAYRHEGFFYAMDTYREYRHLNDLWAKQESPWKVWA